MPSFAGQPMLPQQQYTGFQQFVPELQDYVNQTYVNEETGETLIIPHLNGKPIYPPPAGFVLQVKEDKQEEEVVPETVPTATVTEKVDKEGDSTTFENMQKRENEIQESYKNTIKSVMEQEELSAADAVQFIKDGNYKILGKTVPGFLFPDIKLANQDRNQQKFINFGLEDAANIVQSDLDSLVPKQKPTFSTKENNVIPTGKDGKVVTSVSPTVIQSSNQETGDPNFAAVEAAEAKAKAAQAKKEADAKAFALKNLMSEQEARQAEREANQAKAEKEFQDIKETTRAKGFTGEFGI